MHLSSVYLANFRNYREARFSFNKKISCITGSNGSGKTNLLDAIYYLCITKSYFAATEFQNILHGQSWFTLRGEIDLNGSHVIKCKVEKEKRKDFFLDEKRYEKLADHVGRFPVVFSTPNDVELIYGGSEERRRFLDLMLSQTDPVYLESLQEYNRLLLQRNALLKQFAESGTFNTSLLEVYDSKMVKPASLIYDSRKKAVEEIIPFVASICRSLSDGLEEMSLAYESDLHQQDMWRLLENNASRDRVLKRTSAGVHRDDLVFLMNQRMIRKFASQGQQKSFLIALKLGLYKWLQQKKNVPPFLLLDDIFDKLDHERSSRLLLLLSDGSLGQIFITDTQEQRLRAVFRNNADSEFFTMSLQTPLMNP